MSDAAVVPGPKKRLFVGSFLSANQQQQLGQLKKKQDELSNLWRCKVNLVHGNKMHLTWLFLGYVAQTEIEAICDRLSHCAARHRPLTISYTHWEFWPSPKQARLWVLTPDVVAEPVQRLAQEVKSALRPFVVREEKRPYKPHITLARMEPVKSQKTIPEWLCATKMLPLEQHIDRIDLIESQPSKGAEAYQCLFSFRLGAGHDS